MALHSFMHARTLARARASRPPEKPSTARYDDHFPLYKYMSARARARTHTSVHPFPPSTSQPFSQSFTRAQTNDKYQAVTAPSHNTPPSGHPSLYARARTHLPHETVATLVSRHPSVNHSIFHSRRRRPTTTPPLPSEHARARARINSQTAQANTPNKCRHLYELLSTS